MKQQIDRRTWLQVVGAAGAGAVFEQRALAELLNRPIEFPPHPLTRPLDRPVTAIVAGAGGRGNTYAGYSLKFPEQLKIAGFAEPIKVRSERFAATYGIAAENRFTTWEHIFARPKFADAVIITTPDALHYGPAMAALRMGYDVLLEKAIAQTWEQCTDILRAARDGGRVVGVCHVLRYSPYFRKIKEVLDAGALGRVIHIDLLEPVEHVHMSHSFVRGNWSNTKVSNPMLLSKSCHDLDLLRWYVGARCVRVSSFGNLAWFRRENAPEGSTARCTDGCAVEASCPYSALKIYYRNRSWLGHFDLPASGDQGPAIMENLRTGPYGRCVYRSDNDVVDHQVVSLEFEGGITAGFSMQAHTSYAGRRIRIMGSKGDLVGDEQTLSVVDFGTDKKTEWNARDIADLDSGHGGGDYGLVREWVQAVSQHNPSMLATDIGTAMESHLMGFQAEESRLRGELREVGTVG